MIKLKYRYYNKKSEKWVDGLFDFDDTKYWVGRNNFLNVISDFLSKKIGNENFDSLSAEKILNPENEK